MYTSSKYSVQLKRNYLLLAFDKLNETFLIKRSTTYFDGKLLQLITQTAQILANNVGWVRGGEGLRRGKMLITRCFVYPESLILLCINVYY